MTIQQLEAFSNTKPELRYITEEIIKYLGANPSGGYPGGSSYLVYTALMSQTTTDDPIADELQNDFGIESWDRFAEGVYEAGSNIITAGSNVYINGYVVDSDGNGSLSPFYNGAGELKMFLELWWYDDGGNIVFGFSTYDENHINKDLSELLPGLGLDEDAQLPLPEIRIYQ